MHTTIAVLPQLAAETPHDLGGVAEAEPPIPPTSVDD